MCSSIVCHLFIRIMDMWRSGFRRERRKDLLSDSGSVSLWFASCQSLVPRSSSHPWFPRPQTVGAMSRASFYGFPLQAEFAAQMWLCPLTREDEWILFLRQHRLVGKERLSISPRDRRLATMAAVITFAPVAENIWDTKINWLARKLLCFPHHVIIMGNPSPSELHDYWAGILAFKITLPYSESEPGLLDYGTMFVGCRRPSFLKAQGLLVHYLFFKSRDMDLTWDPNLIHLWYC